MDKDQLWEYESMNNRYWICLKEMAHLLCYRTEIGCARAMLSNFWKWSISFSTWVVDNENWREVMYRNIRNEKMRLDKLWGKNEIIAWLWIKWEAILQFERYLRRNFFQDRQEHKWSQILFYLWLATLNWCTHLIPWLIKMILYNDNNHLLASITCTYYITKNGHIFKAYRQRRLGCIQGNTEWVHKNFQGKEWY